MGRASSTERARRILALLAMLERGTHIPLDELARKLGLPIAHLADDLELLSMCGIAPYGPEDLVPLLVEEGAVHVFGALPALSRRVRLSPAEARALATALQIAGRPAGDPLVERLLAATSAVDAPGLERLVRAATAGDFATTATMASGAARSECVRITYRTGASEEESERVVEPAALFNERGVWYVEAFCRRANAQRTFRVDRIRAANLTGEHFEPRELALDGTALPIGPLPVARIHFEPAAPIPQREWPGMRVIAEDGSGTVVEVPYSGTAWIAREVLSFLGEARVESPAEVRDAVAALARQELDRLSRRT